MNKKSTFVFCCAMIAMTTVRAQPPHPPRPQSNEERLRHVSEKINKEIDLNASQKSKIAAAYKAFFTAMEKLRPQVPPPPPPGKKEDVEKLVRARDAKIKAVLNEGQYKKYREIEQSLRPPRPEGRPPGKKD